MKQKYYRPLFVVVAFLVFSCSEPSNTVSQGKMASIEGTWKVMDDSIATERSKIKISVDKEGVFSGRVMSLYHADIEGDPPVCSKCTGTKKNKLIAGMTIIEGLKQEGNKWQGGTILNVDTGEPHLISVSLIEDGRMLKIENVFINPYKGSKILGDSLIWERVK